jgi:hypothetical protein
VVFHLWNIYRYITLCHEEIGGSKREGHRRGDSTMETSAPAQAQAFLREIETGVMSADASRTNNVLMVLSLTSGAWIA